MMELVVGFFVVIALGFGVTHLCGMAFRALTQLVRLALSRRLEAGGRFTSYTSWLL
jgi:hypothetical protein